MISASDYDFLRNYLKARSGLVLTDDKHYLLESRLEPVMRRFDLPDMARLARALRDTSKPGLADAVVEAMTTNESLFFRDRKPFDILTSVMLPTLARNRRPGLPLRIWCAAASTGQEPYSIAMTLRENAHLLGGRTVEIIGTDLSSDVLDRATAGLYNQFEVQRGLPIQLLLKYFTKSGDQWQIAPELRAMVKFRRLNLLEPFSMLGMFDIVFCRNVLIYFDVPTKENVLARIAKSTASDGYLLLGGAETVMGISDAFVSGPQPGFYVPKMRAMEAMA
ncbi:protein-glutamate O-methyltransferase CheR [Aquabacter sp. CN5-332]|uniref:CheR family methyltransferase n=1 Tax=Aquabacter sp. CN5-332 TaxID=3156608 RepID=UPI0032B5F202